MFRIRDILVLVLLFYLVNSNISYFPNLSKKPLDNNEDIERFVNDTNSLPTDIENIQINNVKKDVISFLKSSNKFTDTQKNKLSKKIKGAKVYVSARNYTDTVYKPSETIAYYMLPENIIVIQSSSFNRSDFKYILMHEFLHYIDHNLIKNKSYSNSVNISEILDHTQTNADIRRKVFKLIDDQFISSRFVRTYSVNLKLTLFKNEAYRSIINSGAYMTSPSEMYVRLINMKLWLIKNKQINDINSPITNNNIAFILSKGVVNRLTNPDVGFLELLFYMNIDWENNTMDSIALKKLNDVI